MPRLDAFSYAVPTTARALTYFPNKVREGLFVSIDDGIAEYAPLTGIHSASLEQAIRAINNFASERLREVVRDAQGLSTAGLAQLFGSLPPLMGYLLSMAHFHNQLGSNAPRSTGMIKLAALIEASDAPTAIALAQTYLAQGFSHLKIKVGGLAIEDEVRKVKTIAAIAGSGVALRLDANRRFTFTDAASLLTGLKRVCLEYVEEPTHEIHRLHELRSCHEAGLAIDESLTDVHDLDWLLSAQVSHVIIKPSRFNNLFTTFNLVKEAKARGLIPIFSHCFESEFSSAIFALMIDELGLHSHAHGILVDGFFRHGVFAQPLRSFRGRLSISDAALACTMPFLEVNDILTRVTGLDAHCNA